MSQHPPRKRLPIDPSAEHLRKQAKRLAASRSIILARAQHLLAADYGCASWADLLRLVEDLQRGSDRLSGGQTGMGPLATAANADDIAQVRAVLAAGSFSRHDLDQALARAVLSFRRRREIAELLLEHGADPDGQYGAAYGPIVLVTGECLDPEGMEFLIRHGADVAFAPLRSKYGPTSPLIATLGTYMRGANERKHRCIDLLLAHGARMPDGLTPAMLAIHRGDIAVLEQALAEDPQLLHRRHPDMPFGNLRLAGGTLLHLAVEVGDIPCIRLLLDRGADINARSLEIDGCGGQTPIFHAVATNQGAGQPVLEHLVRQAGRWIDRDARARLLVHGRPTPEAMTAAAYAAWTMSGAPDDWPRANEHEIALLRSLEAPAIADPAFAAAVAALDAGDLDGLGELLRRHPRLATDRAEEAGAFAGPYFARPALLWFIAENPVRTGRLARNIAAMAQAIIAAGATPADITTTLGLVASGMVPRQSGRQEELIRLLVAAGADTAAALRSAVQHGETAAARLLLQLGAAPDLPALAALGDSAGLQRLLQGSSFGPRDLEEALVLAAQAGHAAVIDVLAGRMRGMLDGMSVRAATALHLAALGGHAAAVERLLAHGADPTLLDIRHQATPAGWAGHGGHADLAAALRRHEAQRNPPSAGPR